ncbi:MAG: hypothetical protein KGI51_09985 [Rhodospirillales bacterium]|nr:hypothetical protein [Rhodospirillales bacterium]
MPTTTLVPIRADGVLDFIDKAARAVGGHEMGLTTYDIDSQYSIKDKKISKIKFTLALTVKRAHWSGGNPDAANQKAIKEAEDLNHEHEEKHCKIAEDICDKAFKELEKSLVGKTAKDVTDAVAELKKQIAGKYSELDRREGKTEVTQKANGSFEVRQVGA